MASEQAGRPNQSCWLAFQVFGPVDWQPIGCSLSAALQEDASSYHEGRSRTSQWQFSYISPTQVTNHLQREQSAATPIARSRSSSFGVAAPLSYTV